MRRDLSYVDVEDALKALGLRNVRRSGDEIDFSCPSGQHAHADANPSARMNSRNALGICHACGWRGDLVGLVALAAGITQTQAERVIEERYGGPERSAEAGGLMREVERIRAGVVVEDEGRIAPSEDVVDFFWRSRHDGATDYLVLRGFTRATQDKWQLGVDPRSDRVTIPVRDVAGAVVGFKGRAWRDGQKPKYLILGDRLGSGPYGFHTYRKSDYVFGLDRIAGGACVVCEGELNAIALHQLGVPAVAVAGSDFSERQAAAIISRCSSVIVYFDADEAGEHGRRGVVEALSPCIPTSVVRGAPDDAAQMWEECLPLIASAVPSLLVATQEAIM